MGIMNYHLIKIGEAIRERQSHGGTLNVAILGYPSMAVDQATVIKAFGEAVELKNQDNYALELLLQSVCDCNIRIFDITCHHGIEEELDLNEPLATQLVNQFDIVIDSSCLEHCFNVAQAFRNICEMTAVGGTVITIAPIYLFNHGYYNINPIMHQDGFTHNGFELLSQHLINNSGEVVAGFSGKKTPPRQIFILSAAKKIQDVKFKFPIQTHKGLGINYE